MTFCDGGWVSFHASGHAQYASKGEDIVCAGFSCLTRTMFRHCLKHGWLKSHHVSDGELEFSLLPDISTDKSVLLVADLLILGLEDLQAEFPKQLRLIREGMG